MYDNFSRNKLKYIIFFFSPFWPVKLQSSLILVAKGQLLCKKACDWSISWPSVRMDQSEARTHPSFSVLTKLNNHKKFYENSAESKKTTFYFSTFKL